MVNLSYLGGHVPKNWKTVMINPPPKKANVELVYKNFRSVSNLPFISKVLEKAALKQLLFLLDHGEKILRTPRKYPETWILVCCSNADECQHR